MCENPSGRGNVGVKFTGGVALDEEEIYESGRRQGRVEGAAVAFGVIGMAIGDPATDGVDSSRGAEGSLHAPRGARA